MTFAERLRQLRIEQDMTLDEVGHAIGVGRAAIYKYEHGIVTNVPPDKVHQLAKLFGVTRPYLMGWTDEPDNNPSRDLDTVAENMRSTPGELVTENDRTYWRATSDPIPDCTTAATQAARALIKFHIGRTPIYPQQILQESKYTSMITFGNPNERDAIQLFTKPYAFRSQDNMVMMSYSIEDDGSNRYLFAVNRNAPIGKQKLSLAVEIGHIYLGHTSFIKDASRKQREAECFAVHLLFPRALIKLFSERGYVFTKDSFSRIFGECEWCLDSILTAQPVSISPELNRLVKEQFTPYVNTLENVGVMDIPNPGRADILDFSRYMDGYED